MKPKLYSYLAIVLFAAIFVIACKKGDTGPAGPAGPAGAAGAAGAAGPKGDSGTANVIYSAWTNVTFSPILLDTISPGVVDTTWGATVTAPKLTADVLSKGEIKVYYNFGTTASPDVVPLPFTDLIFVGWNIQVDLAVGNIYLTANDNFTSGRLNGPNSGQFRYILIPGAVPASVNVKDYNSVKNYFNVPN
jgi:hypothetical protein